jgi:hypothetical protein
MIKEDAINQLVESGPEAAIYILIDHIGAFIWRMEHDMADGRIPMEAHAGIDKEIAELRPQQVALVRCLTRFGVEVPLDEENKPTQAYRKWYQWWNRWHQGMSDEQWDELGDLIQMDMSDEDIARCRPEGKWEDVEL